MRLVAPLVGMLFCVFALQANAASFSHEGPVLLRDVAIIDGTGHLPYPNRDVLLVDGKIARISVTTQIGDLPDGTKVIDERGLTVMPGLMDLHTHIGKVSFKSGEFESRGSLDGLQTYLDATIYAGVTTIFEVGGNMSTSIQLRDEINTGTRSGPTIFTVGPTIGALKTTPNGVRDLTSPEAVAEIDAILDAREAAGIDIIKLYTGITPWEARHIISEANKRGIRAIADFWCSNLSIRLFMVTGLDAYAHGSCFEPLSEEDAAWMAANDKFAMITFTAFDTMGGHRPYADFSEKGFLKNPLVVDVLGKDVINDYYAAFHAIRERFEDGEASLYNSQLFGDISHLVPLNYINVKRMWEAGVLVGMGTDAAFPPGGWPGEAMHFEMEHHAKAGIPNLEVIKMATLNNATFLRIDDHVGTVKTGMDADLLIVRGNPAEKISDTRNIAYVIKGGRILDRKAMKK